MTDFIHNIFSTIFGENIILATILIAMIPIIELRLAIPFARSTELWGGLAMSFGEAFGWSLLGSCLVVFILALIFIPLLNWLKKIKVFKKLALALENRIRTKSSNIDGANEKSKKFSKTYWKKIVAVFVFVATPLPLTGVWTGTCVAIFIGLDYWSTCISVILGNMTAGLLISLILLFFPWLNSWLIYIFLILVAIVIIIETIKYFINKKKQKAEIETQE